mmetsp:Transcript_16787/g.27917  ORF Transcript_16787/g.27917 Transcript_16787/m.27917 type:complete len:80 (-) Transcript_16787:867-1106(-)
MVGTDNDRRPTPATCFYSKFFFPAIAIFNGAPLVLESAARSLDRIRSQSLVDDLGTLFTEKERRSHVQTIDFYGWPNHV